MSFTVTASQDKDLGRHFLGRVRLTLCVDGKPKVTKDVRGPASVKAFLETAVRNLKLPAEEVEQATRAALKTDKFGATVERQLSR